MKQNFWLYSLGILLCIQICDWQFMKGITLALAIKCLIQSKIGLFGKDLSK